MEIEVIQTLYDGILFRSRIEARWATFYNHLGIKYEYEKEGYKINGKMYLPDFYIPHLDCFIEIKGKSPSDEEEEKCKSLSIGTGKIVYLFAGNIPGKDLDNCENGARAYFPEGVIDYKYFWCECSVCGFYGIQFDGRSDRLPCEHENGKKSNGYGSKNLLHAYNAARSARFEYEKYNQ